MRYGNFNIKRPSLNIKLSRFEDSKHVKTTKHHQIATEQLLSQPLPLAPCRLLCLFQGFVEGRVAHSEGNRLRNLRQASN